MSENWFDKFRDLQKIDEVAMDRNAAKFIFCGSMATHVHYKDHEYQAGFVYKNREEDDKAYLYILKPACFEAGEIFTWFDTNHIPHKYLIYEEEQSVKRVVYHKYLCFECNVQIDDEWGYLTGPRSQYVNTQLRQMLYEVSLAKPVLIMGRKSEYEVSKILTISNRNWRIIEKDDYSIPNLTYYYLEQFVAPKDSDVIPFFFPEDEQEADTWRPGQEVTLNTVDGYFESSPVVKARITPTTVTFTVPYDTDELTVVYKTEDSIVTERYKVVM